ncbi:general substrate transporter [Leucosporidium creatinivorum]|uniref:General substrate transporter n=1 Tax=Leucosporidium creatinivorum TaxID=106004 RepID=A0A1Y2FGB6_9BASI|nr:general substrate transporter [Leucosporidium creatinivorum]
MSDSQLKITPKSEHVEDVSATEFGNANLAILHDEALMVAEGEEKMTAFTYLLACAAGLSGLLFGYDTGVISGALVNIGTDLDGRSLTDVEKEWVGASTSCGALFGGLLGGNLADKIGRKWVLAVGDVFFVLGAVLIAASYSLEQIIVGRVVLGFGVGIAAAVTPMYLSELAPTRFRGTLVTIQSLMITGGQVISYGMGAGMTFKGGWRALFAISIIPAAGQAAFIHWLPESPRFDMIQGREDAARKTMRQVYSGISDEALEIKVRALREVVTVTKAFQQRWPMAKRPKLILKTAMYRRPAFVACALMGFQQLCGFNSLMYYSSTIFSYAGFSNPTAVGLIVAGANLSMFLLDRVGKRRLLLWTYPNMIAGLGLAAVAFHLMTQSTGGVLVEGTAYDSRWTTFMLVMMVYFIGSYATALGNIPWHSNELFPLELRGMGASLLTASCWSTNIIISATFLSIMNGIGAAGAFGLYAGICLVGFIFVVFCYPEVSGLSLEEVQTLFVDDFGIKKSQQIRRNHAAARAKETNEWNVGDKHAGSHEEKN